MSYHLLQKTLVGAGAEQLSATTIRSSHVIIQPRRGNAASVFVGDNTVAVGRGDELVAPYPDAAMNLVAADRLRLFAKGGDTIDLSLLYAIGTPGDVLNIFYEVY